MKKMILGLVLAAMGGAAQAATVTIDWDAVTQNADGSAISDLSGYRVFYATYSLLSMTTGQAMSAGTVVRTIPSIPAATTTTLTFASLQDATTYFFRVTAFDASGNQSDFSNLPLEVSTYTPPPAPPAAPGTPSLTVLSDTQIRLNWTDNSNNETGFRVERSLDNVSFSTVTTLGANVKVSTDTGLTASTLYYYRVVARGAAGESVSAVASATTQAPPPPPAAPTLSAATPVSVSQINLTWSNVANETGYKIQRSPDGVSGWVQIATRSADVTTYSNTGLSASTDYSYRVLANNATGDSAPSNVMTARTQDPPLNPPTQPTGFSATAVSSSQIDLAWTDNATDETAFEVVWSLSAAFTSPVTITVPALPGTGLVTYSHTGLPGGTAYYYKVRAINGVGNPALSPATPVLATTQTPPPAAPASISAPALSSTTITVSWGNVANETGYRIERSLSSGSGFVQVAQVGVNVTSFQDTGLAANTFYYYQVRAYNGGGNSGYTAELPVRTGAPTSSLGLTTPAGLKEAYVYPNPSRGTTPILRGFMGGIESMEVTIYDAAGRVVETGRTTTQVNVNGELAFEYRWLGEKTPGVYYAVMHGKKGNETVRARAKFAVVR